MSMFDVARYLSYSNSIDHSKNKTSIFGMHGKLSNIAVNDIIGKDLNYKLNVKNTLYAEPGKGL